MLVFVAAITLVATIPYILANNSIRDRIRAELSAMSGLPVTLQGGISVSVLPTFTARLTDVEIGSPEPLNLPGMHAETIEVELSWLAALGRKVQIKSIRVDNADIRVTKNTSGEWLPATLASPLAPALLQARQAVAANPAEPDFSTLPDWRIGNLSVTKSKVRIVGSDGNVDLIADLNVDASWPGLSMPVRVDGNGIWRGKEMSASALVKSPVKIAAGGNSEVMVKVRSEPVSFEFNGIANLENFFFAEGALTFETPSMRNLLAWLGTEVDPGNALGRLSMSARLTTKDDTLNFDDAVIDLNGNPASGILQLTREGEIPALSGTLAFDTLDIATFLSAFSIGLNSSTARAGMRFLDQLNLDLRLSAKAANAGSVPLTEVAAAVRIKDGNADFDLGDAALYGGRVQANLKISEAARVPDGDMRVRMSDIDPGLLPNPNALPVPNARAQASFGIKGKYVGFLPFIQTGQGEAELSLASGELRNFDIARLRQRLDAAVLFNLPETYRGIVAMKSASVKARIDNGVAVVSEAFFDLAGGQIVFSGAVPFLSRGMALSGAMTDSTDPQSPTRRRFFVGGAWELPFVTPIQ